jgi:hypothetical protein
MLTYPSPGVPALASSSHEPNCRNVTIETEGSVPASVIGVDALVGALAAGAGELEVGELVVGAGLFVGALGRPFPFPLPWPLAFVDKAITRPMARAAVRDNERFVTVAVPLDGRAKGKGQIDPSSFTLDL